MNEPEIVRLHTQEGWTLRKLAKEYSTDHHRIRRILQKNGAQVRRTGWKIGALSEERRAAISARNKGRSTWSAGLTMTDAFKRKVMATKLGTARSLDNYDDFEKLKLLTRLTSKHRASLGLDDETRFAFIDKFYFDAAFNAVYAAWKRNGECKWWYPSLDHIDPKANGGDFALDNLRFITWFENRAKADLPVAEWEDLKRRANTRSDLFIESIMSGMLDAPIGQI